jgi:hypothetical protein
VIDEPARAIRAITYDDNSIAKDFPISFGILWERIIEGVINMPISTIDRSSGVIATTWMYDQRTNKSMLDSLSPFGSNPRVRYKYVLRVVDMGNITRVRVVPFAQTIAAGVGWTGAKASLLVSEKFFERIEKELMIPVSSRRF